RLVLRDLNAPQFIYLARQLMRNDYLVALQCHSIEEVKVKNKINSLILYKKWQTEKSILVDCCFYVLAKCVIKIKMPILRTIKKK
ncbi:hypothetical protein ACEE86_19945, partial [Proteus mirabilis]